MLLGGAHRTGPLASSSSPPPRSRSVLSKMLPAKHTELSEQGPVQTSSILLFLICRSELCVCKYMERNRAG